MLRKSYLINTLTILLVICALTLKAQPRDVPGPPGSYSFGLKVVVLANGNYVVGDPYRYEGSKSYVGAVHLYNGKTHELISTLTGSSQGDAVGGDIVALPNGNFVVIMSNWRNTNGQIVGAVTWGNGTTGVSGTVSVANSLVGTAGLAQLEGVTVLPNGNFVVRWPGWNNGAIQRAGAATWVNGSTGITGTVSSLNSLVGTTTDAAVSQSGITVLTNGNYVVSSRLWTTWCDGTTGLTGPVSQVNSLNSGGKVTALKNGNYVVATPNWSGGGVGGAGAVTWANGATGLIGEVSASNSITGSKIGDAVGYGPVTALSNGNYVFTSPNWDNGPITNAGAATWASGAAASVGVVSTSNSIFGSTANDQVGLSAAIALTNGNYVVPSIYWDRTGITDAGAVTWGNGTTGSAGAVSEANSLVGRGTNDNVGDVVALTNGNYVVGTSGFDANGKSNAGAVTWGDGSTGTVGIVSETNSLVGNSEGDRVGYFFSPVAALTNGNYVVTSVFWNGTPGALAAATWCSGTSATVGVVNSSNSLVNLANYQSDFIRTEVTPLANGNYVVSAPWWTDNDPSNPHLGAVVWGNGMGGTTGPLSAANAMLMRKGGSGGALPLEVVTLPDGNFVVSSATHQSPDGMPTGSSTWLSGFGTTAGEVDACNSITGNYAGIPGPFALYNPVYDYIIASRPGDNKIVIFSPTAKSLPASATTGQAAIAGAGQTPLATNDDCAIIAAIQPGGASPLSGTVDAKVWVESSVPAYGAIPFVARHYEITPAANAGIATGAVTLFFSQSDFDNFNAAPNSIPKLPTGPDDALAITSIRVGKYPGVSGNGTGLPGSYSQGAMLIDPDDSKVKWNADFQRWEVTIDVTGFSGFILQTYDMPLPVRLVSFAGQRVEKDVSLQWETADASNVSHFEIERSRDARQFDFAGKIAFDPIKAEYQFTDLNPFNGPEKLYYRLKMVDLDETFAYSKIIDVMGDEEAAGQSYVYPNPVADDLHIMLEKYPDQLADADISDLNGSVLVSKKVRLSGGKISLDLGKSTVPPGIYTVRIKLTGQVFDFKIVHK